MGKRDLATEDVVHGVRDAARQIRILEDRSRDLIERCTHRSREGRSVLRYQAAGERYDCEYWTCDACGGGQREQPVEERVKAILAREMSFYQYADAVARLMTMKNVDDVIEALPQPFAGKFIEFGIECWVAGAPPRMSRAPQGERFVIGRPLPDEAIEAFRDWFGRQA